MSAWESMPWSAGLCFLLAAVVSFCVLFLIWDSWRHRERGKRVKRSPYAVGRDCYRDIKGVHR